MNKIIVGIVFCLLMLPGYVFAVEARISIAGLNVTIDRPIDFDYVAADKVVFGTNNLNVDGSVTPQSFTVRGFGVTPLLQSTFDITRVMIQMTTSDPALFGDFGDIDGGITNGIVLRRTDGTTQNFWNVKKNSDFALLAYDLKVFDPTHPQAVNGLAVRYTFAGQDKHGVAVRLAPGENLELLVQDDIDSLLSFTMMAQGHIVN